mmetsp:Transcript_9443/g.26708  ORF Transcript_9443/g.26708 Transcript_9443/m.26708 type:complete len:269 (-) Transcript_9443:240-1046(-)
MSAQALTAAFESLVECTSRDVEAVSHLSGFQPNPHDLSIPCTKELRTLEEDVTALEGRLEDIRSFLQGEKECTVKLQCILASSQEHRRALQHFDMNRPQHLPGEEVHREAAVARQGTKAPQRRGQAAADERSKAAPQVTSLSAPETSVIPLVTDAEFAGVSSSTRERLTLPELNEAISCIWTLCEEQTRLHTIPKSKRNPNQRDAILQHESLRTPDHGAGLFLTETQLKTLPIFKAGSGRARAIIHTLRAVKRLKSINSQGITTYLIL